jgi:hypothetical protein
VKKFYIIRKIYKEASAKVEAFFVVFFFFLLPIFNVFNPLFWNFKAFRIYNLEFNIALLSLLNE